jgi:glycosyltransferase involved in cell wall biosynthesis
MDGSSISFLNMVKTLKEQYGIEPYVIHPPETEIGDLTIELQKLNITCFEVPIFCSWFDSKLPWTKKTYLFLRSLQIKYKSLIQIHKIANQLHVDMIHTNVGVIHEGFWSAKLLKIPHVWHLREYQDLDALHSFYPCKSFFFKLLKHSHTVCITHDIQRHFELENEQKSRVIYNPISSTNKEFHILLPKEKYFLIANRINDDKCIEEAIYAFAKFIEKHPDFKLVIAGKASSKSYYESLLKIVAELNLDESVEFIGHVRDVFSIMRSAMALLVTSRFEGFGRMTAEANMCGCLVIGRNTGGTLEILNITHGGWLFNDVDDLAEKMEHVISLLDNKYLTLSQHAQAIALQKFSTERHAYEINSLYSLISTN